MKSRATQVVAPGKVEFIETSVPTLEPGQVLVRTLLLSLCGSDVHRAYYADKSEYPFLPGTTGHEIVGVVEAVNEPSHDLKVGDVALVLTVGSRQDGMTEWYVAQAENVLVLPPGKPLEHYLMGQQLGTVVYTCKRLPNMVGKDVVVIGQGSGGLFLTAMSRRMGARRVISMDLKDARVAAGLKLGATHAFNDAQLDPVTKVKEILDGDLADVVFEAAGEEETIRLAPRLVKVEGILFYFGIPRANTLQFDFETFFRRYSTTISRAGANTEPGRDSTRLALEMVARGDIDVSPLITHRVSFDGVPEALALAKSCDDGVVKIIIEMPGYQQFSR